MDPNSRRPKNKRRANSSRVMLEIVFQLLYGQRNIREFFDLFDSLIGDLAVKVGIGYIKEITSFRKEFIRNNTIPGSPERVIARQCSACKMYALDDAFPLFCKDMPERYVIQIGFKENGCGRPGCKRCPCFPSLDARLCYVASIREGFEMALRAEVDTKKLSVLFRSGFDLKACEAKVLVKCSKCDYTREHAARWTIHDSSRFLQSHISCKDCGHRNGYFRAVDTRIPTVTEAALYSILKGFKKVGCDLTQFPKIPEIILARGSYEKRFEMLMRAKELGTSSKNTEEGTLISS